MGIRFLSFIIYIVILLMVVAVGNTDGSVTGMDSDLGDSDASFLGEDYDDEAGFSIASAGDVNDDGYDDIVLGALQNDDGGFYAGQVYLFFGKPSGWSMDTDLSNADASFIGERAGDTAGISVSGAGDVNGDGFDDLLIGASNNEEGGRIAGQSYLIFGMKSGWSMNLNLSNANASFLGENEGGRSGFKVAGAGDVNNDGYDDILIGSIGEETYLVLGKASGWSMDTDLSTVDASFIGEEWQDDAGSQIASAGDVNGDGYDDFIIGAMWNDEGGDLAGQTYLILGRSSGWSMNTHLSNANASFIGETPGDRSGWWIAGAGDVNADGFDDILIGAYKNDEMDTEAGQTYLIFGKATGWSMDTDLDNADASFLGERGGDNAGFAVACAGDVNGDGYDDILIGALYNDDSHTDAGQTYLIFGKRSGWTKDTNLSDANASFLGEAEDDLSGHAVSGAGDVNGDGYDDILIGAFFNDEGGDNAGQIYLIFSNATPSFGPVPVLKAVEDVPITYDFSGNVSDPDTPLGGLTITSTSPYVTSIDGMNVTFEFPNGILTATVPLNLSDGLFHSHTTVQFTIQPVNDPPFLNIWNNMNVYEDVPRTFDLSIMIGDVDNEDEDLFILLDSPYATAEGLVLSVLFTEPVGEYDLYLNVSDGIETIPDMIHFYVKTKAGPPGAPRNLTATAGDGEVFLTWEPPENDGGYPITGYIFSPWLADGMSPPLVNINIGLVTSYTDYNVVNDRTYHYTVTAVTDRGTGNPSAIAEATPFRPATGPFQVTLADPVVIKRSVTLEWTAPEDDGGSPVTGYIIYRGGTVVEMEPYADVGATTTTFMDEDIKRGETYWYAVVAVNDVAEGEPHYPEMVMIPMEMKEGSPTLGGVFVLLAMLIGMAASMMRRKDW